MFVNELSINTCSPWLLKKKKRLFWGEPAGFQFLFTPWRQTEECWLRTQPRNWARFAITWGKLSLCAGRKAADFQRVCKQLLGKSQEVFGNRAASILNKAGGQVSPKNKGQTHTQGEDFLLCWHKSESVADPCLETGQIITSLLREMGSHQLLFFLLFLFSLWLLCSLDS